MSGRAAGILLLVTTFLPRGVAAQPSLVVPASVPLGPGDQVTLRGSAYCRLDGASFGPRAWFDLEGGGLRVIADHGEDGVRLVVVDAHAPRCNAAGVAAPCLLLRRTLATERLVSVDELGDATVGSFRLEDATRAAAPTPPGDGPGQHGAFAVGGQTAAASPPWSGVGGVAAPASPGHGPGAHNVLAAGGLGLAGATTLVAFAALVRARRRRPLARVLQAARAARRRIHADATLANLTCHVDGLVGRAHSLEAVRRDCAARLRRLGPPAEQGAGRGPARRSAAVDAVCLSVCVDGRALPGATAPDDWARREQDEHARLRADLAGAEGELERIAAALRVIALRSRRSLAAAPAALAGVADELDYRDAALAEVDLAASPSVARTE